MQDWQERTGRSGFTLFCEKSEALDYWKTQKMITQKNNFLDITSENLLKLPKIGLWPGICGKYFLSLPQKNLWTEKTEIAKCLLFNFWVIKFTVISKKAILPLINLAKLVFWSILSLKNWKVNTYLNFLWSEVFLREREEIFSTYFGPKSLLI